MNKRYKENVEGLLTEKEIIRYNSVFGKVIKMDEEGGILKLSKVDADFLLRCNRKIRVCTSCGKGFGDQEHFAMAVVSTDNGHDFDFHNQCFQCEMLSMFLG